MALDQTAPQPKPYVSIRELSALTPRTEQAIRTMMAKGILRESEHFFHVGRRPVFKWEAVPRQPFLPVATIIFAGRRQVNRCSHLMVSGRCDAQIWPTLVASSFPEKRL
jgi:hypothetical protein